MSEVEKTIADIRAMPNNTEAWWVSSLGDNDRFEASKLHALADAYEALQAEKAELRKQVAAINKGVQRYAGVNNRLSAEVAELREAMHDLVHQVGWDPRKWVQKFAYSYQKELGRCKAALEKHKI